MARLAAARLSGINADSMWSITMLMSSSDDGSRAAAFKPVCTPAETESSLASMVRSRRAI
jgi:hypothetical protein